MDSAANARAQVFLVMLPAAVGCLLGSLVLDSRFSVRGFAIAATTVALALTLAAALSPVSGIRRPGRSYRFLNGVARSPRSRQALLVALFSALLVIHWALVLAGSGSFALGVITAAVGGGALLAIGLTYWLPSQPGWRHWSTLVFLFGSAAAGVALALVIALAWPDSLPAGSSAVRAGYALVIAGGGLLAVATVGRSVYLATAGARTADVWALTQHTHHSSYVLAPVLTAVAVLAAAVAFAWPWAVILSFLAASAGQWVQWRLFFVTGVPLSWKTEVTWSIPSGLRGKEA